MCMAKLWLAAIIIILVAISYADILLEMTSKSITGYFVSPTAISSIYILIFMVIVAVVVGIMGGRLFRPW